MVYLMCYTCEVSVHFSKLTNEFPFIAEINERVPDGIYSVDLFRALELDCPKTNTFQIICV